MASGALICDGDVSIAGDGAPLCSGTWLLQPVPLPFSLDQLDPAILGQAALAGYTLVFGLWLSGRGIRALLDLVRSKPPF